LRDRSAKRARAATSQIEDESIRTSGRKRRKSGFFGQELLVRASMSRWDLLDRDAIARIPSSIVELDGQLRKVSLQRAIYPPEVLFLAPA
jgi:hypothetical protein